MLEHFARVVCERRKTFFFGDGVFRALHEVLRGALDTNDGEKAECDGEYLSAITYGSAAETAANTLRQIFDVDTAGMRLTFADIGDLRLQNDGIDNLENSGREIVAGRFRAVASAKILCTKFATEDIDVALAAVKDHFLLHDSDAVCFLRSAETSTDFHVQFDIHRDMDLIEAAVKGDRIDVDVRAENACAFGTDIGRSFDQLACTFGKINGNVFKAIFIPTAIENPVRIYIYRFAIAAAIGRVVSGIGHNDDHSFHEKIRNLREDSKIPLATSYAEMAKG